MKVIACCKVVADSQDVKVANDEAVLPSAHWKISDYDLQALEAASEIAQQTNGTVVALNAGGAAAASTAVKKDILSRGADELYQIVDENLQNADTAILSAALANAVQQIGADIVICGEGSADRYCQQTAIALGETLGWPSVSNVVSIQPNGETVIVERSLEDSVQELEVPLPAVISVAAEANKPALPGMRAILAAGKKPQRTIDAGETKTAAVKVIAVTAPPEPNRKKVMLDGSPVEAAAKLVAQLKQDGIL